MDFVEVCSAAGRDDIVLALCDRTLFSVVTPQSVETTGGFLRHAAGRRDDGICLSHCRGVVTTVG